MATLKNKSGHSVTTDHAPEIVSLRAQGYVDAPKFDKGMTVAGGLVAVINATDSAEAAKPAPKSTK